MTDRDARPHVLVTCEHAGNDVPVGLAECFAPHAELLASHRGFDPGALAVATRLASMLHAPLLLGRYSRLVVDLNRSATNRAVFSEITRVLPRGERQALLERFHAPHRIAVERHVARVVGDGERVAHLAVHTFTRSLNGRVRTVDVGLLYDPSRAAERAAVVPWRRRLGGTRPDLGIRLNQPYRGTSDGLVVTMRRRFPDEAYAGIEIEIAHELIRGEEDARAFAELLAGTWEEPSGMARSSPPA